MQANQSESMLNKTSASFPILTTERLALRQLEMNDEQAIFTLRSDSEINKYLDRPVANTIDDARNFINKVIENDLLYWAITLQESNVLVGTICLFDFSADNDRCEIGYELLTNFQEQGIMKEAAEKVIGYAFNTIKVKRIEAILHRDNRRSVKLLEKCGFENANETGKIDSGLLCYYLTNAIDNTTNYGNGY